MAGCSRTAAGAVNAVTPGILCSLPRPRPQRGRFGESFRPGLTRTIKKVRDAYTVLKANIRAGNLGKEGSKRRRTA
ncbi:hypothetical protein ACFXJQ_47550, partial [Streptomyces sp. NPDC059349]